VSPYHAFLGSNFVKIKASDKKGGHKAAMFSLLTEQMEDLDQRVSTMLEDFQ
jgi:hypothetical protein